MSALHRWVVCDLAPTLEACEPKHQEAPRTETETSPSSCEPRLPATRSQKPRQPSFHVRTAEARQRGHAWTRKRRSQHQWPGADASSYGNRDKIRLQPARVILPVNPSPDLKCKGRRGSIRNTADQALYPDGWVHSQQLAIHPGHHAGVSTRIRNDAIQDNPGERGDGRNSTLINGSASLG